MKTICIQCPVGCPIEIKDYNGNVVVTGNGCKRGLSYGISEYVRPVRTVTTLARLEGGGVVSVKTSSAVPKDRIIDVLKAIREMTAPRNCAVGDKLASNVLGLGSDIVVTGRPD